CYPIATDADDGVETAGGVWLANGYNDANLFGVLNEESQTWALRFALPDVAPGTTFAYARVVFHADSDGTVDTGAQLSITGAALDGVADFAVAPPSSLPRTTASVSWSIAQNWPHIKPALDSDCFPLERTTPDLSAIINEILSSPTWGAGADGKTLAIIVENAGASGSNAPAAKDFHPMAGPCEGFLAPRLELYPDVRSTFVARELLTRPTDSSVTITAASLLNLEVFAEYGDQPSSLLQQTPVIQTHGAPFSIVLTNLTPNALNYYRLRYRPLGAAQFESGPLCSVHTQRPRGQAFRFTIQSDSHLQNILNRGSQKRIDVYRRTIQRIAADAPEFHFALGDTFQCENDLGRDVVDLEEAVERHVDQRRFLDDVCHSAPFFFALGNHEGEQGWRLSNDPNDVPVLAARARMALYPQPTPDGFYTGNATPDARAGLLGNYYAFEWGDALFVVIDPYWFTTVKPHNSGPIPGTNDAWDWTLGADQYRWLRQTLEGSDATFKFVFAHQVTGGTVPYGRGGASAAQHLPIAPGSFEWGGRDLLGAYTFPLERDPNVFVKPVHRLMRDANVSIFFHGHDHVFAREIYQGVVYQECPQPSQSRENNGFAEAGKYDPDAPGTIIKNNTGHLRVSVAPASVRVEYIRTRDPNDPNDGAVAAAYDVRDCNCNGVSDVLDIWRGVAVDADGDYQIDSCHCDCADLDASGQVDITDLAMLLSAFDVTPAGDVDCDCDTDLADLAALLAQFNTPCP
ncbi:MAG: hypothetical protein D6744_12400, partial [Planctomycetota bacterium]